MADVMIQALSWHRFNISRFSVSPDLVGITHSFNFRDRKVEIRLPALETNNDGSLRKDKIECYSWKNRDGNLIPLKYHVYCIDVTIGVPDQLAIPEEALKVPPKREELFTPSQKELLDQLVGSHAELAAQAIEYWLRVIRWKSHIGYIGQPRLVNHASGWRAYLQEVSNGHSFWAETAVLVVEREDPVTQEHWLATQLALTAGVKPPIWFSFLFNAEHQLENSDRTGAVLSMAIAFEAMIRTLITRDLASGTVVDPMVLEIIDNANLRSILNRLKKMKFWSAAWDKHADFSLFHQLMNARDRIMHSADTVAVLDKDWAKILGCITSFAYFLDEA